MESLLPALRSNIAILLEKLVVTTIEDCEVAWQAYERAGCPPLAVGFVRRYTLFYRKEQ